ncbi:MAG: very short patch repair endonuclease [Actinomycetota bacterium]|nr:very short patch repair endonuclease [Actinomycetota bacterium]
MQSNKRRDTKPELAIRKQLFARGARYRVDYPLWFDRRRHADIVFPKQKIAVFIDGCFWHGCTEHYTAPQANAEFWRKKVLGNRSRDNDTNERLTELGWLVLRFWEHEAASAVVEVILAARDDGWADPRASASATHISTAAQ